MDRQRDAGGLDAFFFSRVSGKAGGCLDGNEFALLQGKNGRMRKVNLTRRSACSYKGNSKIRCRSLHQKGYDILMARA